MKPYPAGVDPSGRRVVTPLPVVVEGMQFADAGGGGGGATLGDGLGDGLGEGFGEILGDGLGDGLGEGFGDGLSDGLGEGRGAWDGDGLGEGRTSTATWSWPRCSSISPLTPFSGSPIHELNMPTDTPRMTRVSFIRLAP